MLSNMLKQLNIKDKDLDLLKIKFQKSDKSKDGLFAYNEFCNVLGYKIENTICNALFKLFQHDKDIKLIDYREFLIAFANIIIKDKNIKAEYLFKLFDKDDSNSIDKQELLLILQSTYMAKEEQIYDKANRILAQADKSGDGELDLNEFRHLVKKYPHLIFPTE